MGSAVRAVTNPCGDRLRACSVGTDPGGSATASARDDSPSMHSHRWRHHDPTKHDDLRQFNARGRDLKAGGARGSPRFPTARGGCLCRNGGEDRVRSHARRRSNAARAALSPSVDGRLAGESLPELDHPRRGPSSWMTVAVVDRALLTAKRRPTARRGCWSAFVAAKRRRRGWPPLGRTRRPTFARRDRPQSRGGPRP